MLKKRMLALLRFITLVLILCCVGVPVSSVAADSTADKDYATSISICNDNGGSSGSTLVVGESVKLKVIYEPRDAIDRNIRWVSFDTNIAKVDNGFVTACNLGSTKIRAINKSGVVADYDIEVVDENDESVWEYGNWGSNIKWYYRQKDLIITGAGDMMEASHPFQIPWRDCETLSIQIQEGITSICENAFSAMKSCEIEIPSTVTKIGRNAFYCFGSASNWQEWYYGGTPAQWKEIVVGDYNDGLPSEPDEYCRATGHIEVFDLPIKATCLSPGKGLGVHCSVCDKVILEAKATYDGECDYDEYGQCNVCKKIPPTSVTLDKESLIIFVESFGLPNIPTETLTATVYPTNSTQKELEWSSSNNNVAIVNNGLIIPRGYGTATIAVNTLYFYNNENNRATCKVIIEDPAYPFSVTLDKACIDLGVDETETLVATIFPSTARDKNIIWSSSDTSVATVSDGTITAVAPGAATITARTRCLSRTATCEVSVEKKIASVTSVALNKSSTSLTVGDTEILTATVNPSDATNKNVAWSSSNTGVAIVTDGVVTAVAPGTATITVATVDEGKTASCTVTVEETFVIASGTCGDNAIWNLTEDGVLTISGSGAMWDYEDCYDVPWSKYGQNIVTVVIEDGISSIGKHVFLVCGALEHINVDEGNLDYSSLEGVLFNKEQTSLIAYPMGRSGSYKIPANVTNIEAHAFSYCLDLTSLEIPASVTNIGEDVFSDCTTLEYINVDEGNLDYSSLEGVLFNKEQTSLIKYPAGRDGAYKIPASVTSIETYAFSYCHGLTSIEIPSSVTNIGAYAFAWCCLSLISIEIPNSVTNIGESAFYCCNALTSIEIPSSVTSIGKRALGYCNSLTSIEIPSSVTNIGENIFGGCYTLEYINVDEENLDYSSLEGVLFNKEQTSLIACPAERSGAYKIPASVTSIEAYAFVDCSTLTSIEIPSSVRSIGPDAFYGCRGLTIYGYEGSYAETYANEKNIPFVNISNPVIGISLNKTSTTLNVGTNEKLTVTVSPTNATNKNITWTSSDTSVATVTDGVVTAVAPGTATITVTTDDGNKTATCAVTVEAVVNPNAPKLVVSGAKGTAGDTVTVTVDLENNPGFAGLNAYITYSDDLTLVEATNMITDLTFTNDSTMVWDAASDYSEDGELLKLTFAISEEAEVGEHFVKVHFIEAYTAELDDVTFTTVDGVIEVVDFTYGDANGDNEINTKDIILIRRHVAAKNPITGESTVEAKTGADANGDGVVNTKDIILVRRYVAAKNPVTGESSVVLGPNK